MCISQPIHPESVIKFQSVVCSYCLVFVYDALCVYIHCWCAYTQVCVLVEWEDPILYHDMDSLSETLHGHVSVHNTVTGRM